MKIDVGVYQDIPMVEYAIWDAANYSTLKMFKRSAAHAREHMINPMEQTAAMALGSATHAAVLEPEAFRSDYAVAPKLDRRFKKDKLIWAKFLEDNKDREVLTEKEFYQCQNMAKMGLKNPVVAELLKNPGYREFSFVWVDEDTEVLCKARVDHFGRLWGNAVIADLKTTEDASENAWKRDVVKYQYHTQAAFYLDGLDAVSPSIERKFIWIAIEKEPPYAVAIYEPDAATLDKGRRMYRNYLRQWVACHSSGVWPGYPEGIQPLLLPDWALRQEEGEDEP